MYLKKPAGYGYSPAAVIITGGAVQSLFLVWWGVWVKGVNGRWDPLLEPLLFSNS